MSYFTPKDGQRLYYEDKGNGSDTVIDSILIKALSFMRILPETA